MQNVQPMQLSDNTLDYLMQYNEILSCMIHDMECAEMTDSISHNFIVKMIPHHKAAVEMCRNLLRFTTYIPLQYLANEIIDGQLKGIEQMQSILDSCSECQNNENCLSLYERKDRHITKTMFAKMESAPETNNINLNFICEMLPHHKGAVRMSQNALRFEICGELKPLLESIIFVQTQQIEKMEYLYHCLK
ncbi:MAG: DUF305 domain-containing protein [Faecalibacterium sp.]|nr:DUF305 domain-containing protein [Ruminococcus sp.]MCM1392812.1 DUF305 domain-containing protein [Ruminococcus sp.]MCM1485854.1 DUF305 domain-containing protein [Faecalibacterium sp.]